MAIMDLKNIYQYYEGNTVLRDINFSLDHGEVLGIVGPNGSGKTTLLSIIMGLSKKYKGHVYKNDGVIQTGLIEEPTFYDHLSAKQNIDLVKLIREDSKSQTDNLLNIVGLLNSKDKKYVDFSLGMKQRLAIAAVLVGSPDLIILDEPTNGLDPLGILDLRQIIRSIKDKSISVIITSHMLGEIEQLCDNILIIKYGEQIFHGSINKLLETEGSHNFEEAVISIMKK
jgi:ABC-type multidrug transport system ATPase subunit